MNQIVHEVTCWWPPCQEKVGTSESFNALAFLLTDLGWASVKEAGQEHWFCPLHLPAEKDPHAKYYGYCINCGFDFDEEYTENDFPYVRSEHSKSCFNDTHPDCRASDVKFRPVVTPEPDPEKKKDWERLSEEATAQEMYVAMLIAQDQWRRTEDELMSKRSWLVRKILKFRNQHH